MSRLTIVMNGKAYCNNPKCQGDCIKCYRFSTILQNLSYYENLEEQGYKMVNIDKVVKELKATANIPVTEDEECWLLLDEAIEIVKGVRNE